VKIAIEDRVIEVDDNASQAEIEDIVNDFSVRLAGEKERMAKTQKPIDKSGDSAAQAFTSSIGRGFVKSGRGLRTLFNLATGDEADLAKLEAERKEEKKAFKDLEEQYPIATTTGQIVGEIGALAPAGLGVGGLITKGAGKIAAPRAAQIAGAGGAGVTEGAIIGADEGQAVEGGAIGGLAGAGLELILPKVGRLLRNKFGDAAKLDQLVEVSSDGSIKPTPVLKNALAQQGDSFDNVLSQAQREAVSPEQAELIGAYGAEGVTPATKTRIFPDKKAQQAEAFLMSQTDSNAADKFVENVIEENRQIKARFGAIADDLGLGGEEAGESIKNALYNVKSDLRSTRNKAYEDLAEAARYRPEIVNMMPLNQDYLKEGLSGVRNLGLDDSTNTALVGALRDYGLIERVGKADELGKFLGEPEVKDFNLGTLSDFRTRILNAFDVTKPKEAKARRVLSSSIDDMEGEIIDAFEGTGEAMPALIQQKAKAARETVKKEKRMLESRDLVNQLLKPKAAGLQANESPLVASSKVFNKIATKSTPVEDVRKLVSVLEREAGEEGAEAIGNLQASTMLNLLDGAIIPSKKLSDPKTGEKIAMLSGTKLENEIKKLGEDKIRAIFKNNKEALDSLSNLRKIAERSVEDFNVVQKGSLPTKVMNELFNKIAKIRNVNIVGGIGDITEGVRGASALKQTQKIAPDIKDLKRFIAFQDNEALSNIVNDAIAASGAVVAAEEATEK